MTVIYDLKPGDVVTMTGIGQGIFIGAIPQHPIYHGLSLVIWWLVDEERWSHDALNIFQEIPGVVDTTKRNESLRFALLQNPKR